MSAPRGYVVGVFHSVEFGTEIRRYMETIEATFEPFGGEWIVHGTQPEVLEGLWSADLVIVGFPSVDAARDWYASEAYQEILELRTKHSQAQVVLLQGVPEGDGSTDTIVKLIARGPSPVHRRART